MNRLLAVAASVFALAGLAACDFPVGFPTESCSQARCDGSGSGGVPQPAPYMIAPSALTVLKGDTVELVSCTNHTYSTCASSSSGNIASAWTATGVAELVRDGADPAPTSSIRVRGAAADTGSVTGTSHAGTVTVPFIFVDSAAVRLVELSGRPSRVDSLRVGATSNYWVTLRDAFRNPVRGAPTRVTTSDSTLLVVSGVTRSQDRSALHSVLRVDALRPGTVTLVVHFLGEPDTRTVHVLP